MTPENIDFCLLSISAASGVGVSMAPARVNKSCHTYKTQSCRSYGSGASHILNTHKKHKIRIYIHPDFCLVSTCAASGVGVSMAPAHTIYTRHYDT